MRIILIFIGLSFSCSLYAYEFCEHNYPFKPFVREISPVLDRILNNDILFVGESHVGSSVLIEKKTRFQIWK